VDGLRFSFCELGADALLVSHLPNILYLCGFTGSSGVLLVEQHRNILFTDSRYRFQAREEVRGAHVQIVRGGLMRAVGNEVRSHRGHVRVGFSPDQLTVAQKAVLQASGGSKLCLIQAVNLVEKLRAVKDAAELDVMREAASVTSRVFRKVLRSIRPGATELGIAARIELLSKGLGATGPSFETIVASGERSAWAHARPTSKPLRKNELVVLDQGAILRAYRSDMTRTVFVGRASRKVRALFRAVLEAQEAAEGIIRPGVKAGEVDAAARQILRRHRLARYFTHSTGHGLGLEVHEIPRLGSGEETLLEEGMVVTVEPGVYLEGLGGIRIEDEVVVTSKGAVVLTTAPREFIEL
jgi:Xaa-Pro aminopeptidase